ncbi:hypothetical protein ACI3SI_19475, partial [Lactococcus lactis]
LTKIQSVSGFISLGIISLCIFIGILGGNLTSVSIAVSGSYFLNFIVSGSLLMRRALDSNFFQLFKVIIKPLFLGIILSVIVILKSWKKLLSKARLINRLPETIKFKK